MITPLNAAAPAAQAQPQPQPQAQPSKSGGLDSLGQADFLRLMTVQIQQQDPFDPVDQTQMLAQMAQFSSVAGIAEINQNLKDITSRLDALSVAQEASNPSETPSQET